MDASATELAVDAGASHVADPTVNVGDSPASRLPSPNGRSTPSEVGIDTAETGDSPSFSTKKYARLGAAAFALSQLAPTSLPLSAGQSQSVNLETIMEQVVEVLAPMAARLDVQLRLRPGAGPAVIRCMPNAVKRLLTHVVQCHINLARPSDSVIASLEKLTLASVRTDGSARAQGNRVAVRIENPRCLPAISDSAEQLQHTLPGGDVRDRALLGDTYYECRDIVTAFEGRIWAETGTRGGIAICVDFPSARHKAPTDDSLP